MIELRWKATNKISCFAMAVSNKHYELHEGYKLQYRVLMQRPNASGLQADIQIVSEWSEWMDVPMEGLQ